MTALPRLSCAVPIARSGLSLAVNFAGARLCSSRDAEGQTAGALCSAVSEYNSRVRISTDLHCLATSSRLSAVGTSSWTLIIRSYTPDGIPRPLESRYVLLVRPDHLPAASGSFAVLAPQVDSSDVEKQLAAVQESSQPKKRKASPGAAVSPAGRQVLILHQAAQGSELLSEDIY